MDRTITAQGFNFFFCIENFAAIAIVSFVMLLVYIAVVLCDLNEIAAHGFMIRVGGTDEPMMRCSCSS